MRDKAATLEDLNCLDGALVGAVDAAARTGFPSPSALEKWLERHDEYSIWLRMKARDPEGWHHQQKEKVTRMNQAQDDIAHLIETANRSDKARIRAKAQRVANLIADLRAVVAQDVADTKAREEARREVERLEKKLREAKARLRKPDTATPSASEIRAWAAVSGIECPAKGRVPRDVQAAWNEAQGA